MDDELKRYLDGIAANIATAMRAMENRIMSALKSTEVRLDAEARPLDNEGAEANSDAARIEAGHWPCENWARRQCRSTTIPCLRSFLTPPSSGAIWTSRNSPLS